VNGGKILREDRYDFGAIAIFIKLKKDNTFEVNIKDDKPSGFRRPQLPPRSVTITVMPAPVRIGTGSVGLMLWDELKTMTGAIQKIETPGGEALAFAAANLQNDLSVRTEAMRKLSDLKTPAPSTFPFSYHNYQDKPEVCGTTARHRRSAGCSFPALMRGCLIRMKRSGSRQRVPCPSIRKRIRQNRLLMH
jgi:hypothetical protein